VTPICKQRCLSELFAVELSWPATRKDIGA
jgi:hypothetical protein